MKKRDLPELLRSNPYPGRGIILGKSADGLSTVAVYFIMGRSENSRNRVFVPTDDGIQTEIHDHSKITDPALIIYNPVRKVGKGLIVTNGDQTDTIRDYLQAGRLFTEALNSRTFEPDPPNYTPRISGLLKTDGSFRLSILKKAGDIPDPTTGLPICCRYFFHYAVPPAGEGRYIHTYQHDGNPLPSFEGEPLRVSLDAASPEELADQVWDALNDDNKVSLFVRFASIADGSFQDVIRNKYDPE